MMAHSTFIIVLVAALLITTLSFCSAENVYCVTPAATSCSSCPHNTHCATLSEYAREAELYFTSNTTMVFLPGDHVLDVNITVANVSRLTMRGKSSSDNIATVVRNGSVGFSFTNMVDFNIYSLSFTSYNRSLSYGSHPASNSALFLRSTQNAKLVNCSFHDNLGVVLTVHSTSITLVENGFTHNECVCKSFSERCILGCGITAFNSILTFTGNTSFFRNRHYSSQVSKVCAGAILAVASSLEFNGINNFVNNVNVGGPAVGVGGAIYITNNAVLVFNGNNNFINNSADDGGGAIYSSDHTLLSFTGTNSFIDNHVNSYRGVGGAIFILHNAILTFSGTNKFIGNSANNGGAIYAKINISITFSGTSEFSSNSAILRGGALSAAAKVVLTFNGTNNFIKNFINHSAQVDTGGAIRIVFNSVLTFTGTTNFIGNSAYTIGGGIFAVTNISLSFTGTSNFNSNSAMQGGAICANRKSTLTFNGSISFINNGIHINAFSINSAGNALSFGGAIYVGLSSTIFIFPNTAMYWENNHANVGGAIYVYNVNPSIYCTQIAAYIPREKCFFQLAAVGDVVNSISGVQLVFKNNSADDAGSVLYGGAIDNCKLTGLDSYSSGEVFDMLVHIEDDNTNSKISSEPLYICPCKNNFPDFNRCNSDQYVPHQRTVYPGETFEVSVVGAGQRDGAVSSTVRGTAKTNIIESHTVNLLDYQYLQQTNNTCTKLNYTAFSLSQEMILVLHPESSPCSKYISGSLYFLIKLHQTCPPGFKISESARSCVCEQRLVRYTNQCNITNGVGQITRESGKHFWVGYNHSSHELILHPQCTFDYCINDAKTFPLNSTDVQCAYNRSGLLCGRCKEGYSLVLGTHQCRKCTNSHLALLIPFAVIGVALVFMLLICKLTVAAGTLSGLVFYANIIGANRTMFLPVKSTDALSVFIAWLNLDFGIETCFYDGMDAYTKTWLQFVFPVYLWVLVGLMILISHYLQKFANLLGSNPVSVLATLILLSYAKILRTLVAVVHSTQLKYPTYNRTVWLYDANIDYLVGKHIPLFLVAVLVFFFLSLPYTLLLLFGQWLQAISHLRLFSWVNNSRLKPFLDAYHAPYKAKHRYWPGLLLVLRFVLLMVFAFSRHYINLLIILLGTVMLIIWAWVCGGIYRNWFLDALEGLFALNLILLSVFTHHVQIFGGNQLAVGYTSAIIALVTFIAILAYHIFQQVRHAKLWKKVPKLNVKFKKLNTKEVVNNPKNPINHPTESVNLDQLREPWLEDLLQPTHSSL